MPAKFNGFTSSPNYMFCAILQIYRMTCTPLALLHAELFNTVSDASCQGQAYVELESQSNEQCMQQCTRDVLCTASVYKGPLYPVCKIKGQCDLTPNKPRVYTNFKCSGEKS